MRMMRKASFLCAVLCMMVLFFSTTARAYGGTGTIEFSNLEVGVDYEVEIVIVVRTPDNRAIGDINIPIIYDPYMLEFVSGTTATLDWAGQVTVSGVGDGNISYLRFTVVFQALQVGETPLRVGSYITWFHREYGYYTAEDALWLANPLGEGHISTDIPVATVTITEDGGPAPAPTPGPGEGVPDDTPDNDIQVSPYAATVVMGGITYALFEHFADNMIPPGFSRGTLLFEGLDRQAIVQDGSGIRLAFLVANNEEPILAKYNEAEQSFSPVFQASLNPYAIFLLDRGEAPGAGLPNHFISVEVLFGDMTFTGWRDPAVRDFSIVYALGPNGTEGFYQWDSVEGTFQRFIPVEVEVVEELDGWQGRVLGIVQNNFMIVFVLLAIIFLFLLILLIVVLAKLRRVNDELDDAYDAQSRGRRNYRDDDYEDDYDDDEDDSYDDDDDDYDDYDDDDYDDDNYDFSDDEEDDFNVDFVDL